MHKSSGMTFIEVLVALVILATGILGAVAMQASATKGSFDAMQRSIASAYAQDIIEKIRSNRSSTNILEAYEGTYGGGSEASNLGCNKETSLCTPVQMVANDRYEWEQRLLGADVKLGTKNVGGLMSAKGCIEHNKNSVTVVVSWEGRASTKDSADLKESTLATNCGKKTDNTNRRQVIVKAFIF